MLNNRKKYLTLFFLQVLTMLFLVFSKFGQIKSNSGEAGHKLSGSLLLVLVIFVILVGMMLIYLIYRYFKPVQTVGWVAFFIVVAITELVLAVLCFVLMYDNFLVYLALLSVYVFFVLTLDVAKSEKRNKEVFRKYQILVEKGIITQEELEKKKRNL